ncbi:RNA polymerase sigma factor [Bacillus carboniphilus]|uniref:RNA polymerase sigma factor n=1 Tax=Bacillus carboniphilus TaxID=86663 RepID=A0ABN0WJ68_9BACI
MLTNTIKKEISVDTMEVERPLEQLIRENHQPIFNYCYQILRNQQDAEDAVQEVFIKALMNYHPERIIHQKAWLYKIAYRHCLNKSKRNRLFQFIPFTEKYKSSHIHNDHSQNNLELDYILAQLKAKERAILALRIIEDRDYEEIGQILNINSATARKRFERVKLKVQKIIEGRMDHE